MSRVYRFLLSSRWLGIFALSLAVAVACVLLGTWQWNRGQDRVARNALVTENYDREPVPLADVLPGADVPPGADDLQGPAALPTALTWTPVRLLGQYVSQATVLVRNRPLDGSPGYHVLVPFRTGGGAVLVVDRGWLPVGQTGEGPDDVPAPPAGEVEVVARLRPPEPADDRRSPVGQTQRINPAALADELAFADGALIDPSDVLVGAYGQLGSEVPAPAQAPRPLPRPALDEGPHLSYAMQWVVFAIGALVGFVVLARRTAQDEAPAPARPVSAQPRRRPTAEDEEDAILDAADAAGRGHRG